MNLANIADEHKRKSIITLMTFLVYALAENARAILRAFDRYSDAIDALPDPIRWLENGVIWTAFCIGSVMLFYRLRPLGALRELGLIAPVWPAYLFAIAMTAPMWLPPLVLPGFGIHFDPLRELYNAGIWPLGEEILYRGFVFLQLYRRAGWSFWSSAGLSSLIFGLVHLGNAAIQNEPLGEQAGIVVMISSLTIFGAWILIQWNYNLWFMIAGHGLMNFCWSVFKLGDNPLGGWGPNAMRISAVALAVAFTYKREAVLKWLQVWRSRPDTQNGALEDGP